jgi:voltage-gated potassium channel
VEIRARRLARAGGISRAPHAAVTAARTIPPREARPASDRLRWRALSRLEQRLEIPMAVLGLIWLGLFVLDVTSGSNVLLEGLGTVIWVVFAADYALRLLIAPRRLSYLKHSWLTALSLVVPALRLGALVPALRALRIVRAAPGVRLVRAVGSLNRGMSALGSTLHRRGVPYVFALTAAATFAGAAGMYALEPHAPAPNGFASYADALWWTAMVMTTMGSAYWPQTPEGRILAFLLALFAIGVFGFITATLASFFVDRDAASDKTSVASAEDLRALRAEIAGLRAQLRGAASARGAESTTSS